MGMCCCCVGGETVGTLGHRFELSGVPRNSGEIPVELLAHILRFGG